MFQSEIMLQKKIIPYLWAFHTTLHIIIDSVMPPISNFHFIHYNVIVFTLCLGTSLICYPHFTSYHQVSPILSNF